MSLRFRIRISKLDRVVSIGQFGCQAVTKLRRLLRVSTAFADIKSCLLARWRELLLSSAPDFDLAGIQSSHEIVTGWAEFNTSNMARISE